jgi:putative hydrolase of HD superfamily
MNPEDVVRRQLDAYNDRDLEEFIACWAQDARILAWPDILLADGAAAISERHRARFADTGLHARLVSRTSVEELVVDREVVTRMFESGRGSADVIGVYEVVDGLIRRAWFKQGPVRPPER